MFLMTLTATIFKHRKFRRRFIYLFIYYLPGFEMLAFGNLAKCPLAHQVEDEVLVALFRADNVVYDEEIIVVFTDFYIKKIKKNNVL